MESTNQNGTKLCRICMAFHGTSSTAYLCSKCFKEQKTEEQRSAATQPATAVSTLLGTSLPEQPALQLQEVQPSQPPKDDQMPPVQAESSNAQEKSTQPVEEQKDHPQEEEKPKVQENKNKCWQCNRKVGSVQTECKCGYVYCPKCRHSEKHNCSYDYHAQQKQLLSKNNPQIMHQKMEKMI